MLIIGCVIICFTHLNDTQASCFLLLCDHPNCISSNEYFIVILSMILFSITISESCPIDTSTRMPHVFSLHRS